MKKILAISLLSFLELSAVPYYGTSRSHSSYVGDGLASAFGSWLGSMLNQRKNKEIQYPNEIAIINQDGSTSWIYPKNETSGYILNSYGTSSFYYSR